LAVGFQKTTSSTKKIFATRVRKITSSVHFIYRGDSRDFRETCPEPYAREEVLEECFADLPLTPSTKATLIRRSSKKKQSLGYNWNKQDFRIDLISSMKIGLMDSSRLLSLNARRKSGDSLRHA
jgi:hypothetical protein